MQAEEYELLWSAFENIDKHHQEVLRLRFICEWSYDRISQALGVPVGTVKSRIHRSLAALARVLRNRRESF